MRIVIADDEPLARQRLRDMLATLDDVQVVGEASTGREACELANQLTPDALLLDISMPVMDGIEAAQHMAHMESPPAVIFCTAFDEHALAAFEAGAVDYLLKPIRAARLGEALLRARRFSGEDLRALQARLPRNRQRSHLCARLRGHLRLIPISEVRYLQAEEKYVVVHHANGEDLIEEPLKTLEVEFGEQFLRIHRNCLVARDELIELRRGLDGQTRAKLRHVTDLLEVSRRCLPLLRQRVREL
ncbi:MAG: LytR/AlgR family response regulator transcription factor [Pseudomarimonas sp.]